MGSRAPFDMVIFGVTGDLSTRKLLPALYYRHRDGQLPDGARIVGTGRSPIGRDVFHQAVEKACRTFVPTADFDEDAFAGFVARTHYVAVNAAEGTGYDDLKTLLDGNGDRVRVYFLATSPDWFASIAEQLAAVGLADERARIVLEKPLGRDLASARVINQRVGAVFDERQIYRIDHYLGKETVQNLMALRFGNALFEPLWRRGAIQHVQITIAETVGVEGRAEYYDKSGALRDMVQNHLLQLLCMLAMEPPISSDPDAIRDEKVKVLRALRPLTGDAVLANSVRAQYRAGAIGGQAVVGYLDEAGVPEGSSTETYAFLRAHIDNWRWAGVPFYLRTGKRMARKVAEIVIDFAPVPHPILASAARYATQNRLVIRLQPKDEILLYVLAKQPGDAMVLTPVNLHLDFAESFSVRPMEAYERLLMDAIEGRPTLFTRNDELEAAWAWIDPVAEAWATATERPRSYAAGTMGPPASAALIAADGHEWFEED